MKNLQIALFVLVFVIGLQQGNAQKSYKYDLPAFTQISLKNDANLILKQDTFQSVTVKAKDETISKLVVEVSDRKLTIRFPGNVWFDSKWSPGDITIYVTTPQIDELSQSGSGSIVAEQLITSRILDLYMGGSGFIRLNNLKADKISGTVSGSGHLQLAGTGIVAESRMIVSGSGGIKAPGLKTKSVNVLISGSGNCSVFAIEKLSCKIAGSGGVTYYGNPAIEQTIVGSGTVKEGK